MKTTFCHHCGAALPTAAKFCQACGTRVPEITIAVSTPEISLHPAPASSSLPPGAGSSGPEVQPLPNPGALPPDPAEEIARISRQSDRNVAAWGLIVGGLIVALFSPIDSVGVHLFGLVLYCVPAFGIWKKSRVAAVVGLLIGLANIVLLLALMGKMGSPQAGGSLAPVFVAFCYWCSFLFRAVLGTFAFHRYRKASLKR